MSESDPAPTTSTVEQIKAHFASLGKTVLTFAGYSGLGYQDETALRTIANRYLKTLDPEKTIINAGATPEGIGVVYEWAVAEGFMTTGIVSSLAMEYGGGSPFVNNGIYYVQDETWGGYLEGTTTLSPTSEAMVAVSQMMVAIGGGAVALDEMTEMKKRNKAAFYLPAEMNHEKARAKALKNGDPEPTDFLGPLHAVFSPEN